MTANQVELAAAMGVELPFDEYPNLPPPELFPKRPAWIARNTDRGRALDIMNWGFPHMVKTPKTGKLVEKAVTNVRAISSAFWRTATTNPDRRCLVGVTSFSEYGPGTPGKLPLHWFSVPSRPVFAFAGVWRPVGQGAVFAFLTCDPNPLVASFHPKVMPVILDEADYARWLSCSFEEACALATPYPSQLMSVESPPELSTIKVIEDALLV